MSTEYAISIGLNLVALCVDIILFIASLIGGNRKEPIFRWFYFLSLFGLISILLNILFGLMQGMFGLWSGYSQEIVHWSSRIASYFIAILDSLQMFAYAMYLFAYLKTKVKLSQKPAYLMFVFCIINIILATISLVNGMYGRLDEFNNYQQHDLYWVSAIFPILALFVGVLVTMMHVRALKPKEWILLLVYQIAPIIFAFAEVNVPDLWITQAGAAIVVLLIYVTIQVDLIQRVQTQETQLAESRIAITLSQIQPHFLYNSLAAINELCDQSPDAQTAIVRFSKYLRGNMESLTQHGMIRFEKELAHVKQYLWLEELRFGKRLQVVYDIQTTEFFLPPLSLQPIVENAVRHGITKKRLGGTVTIQTKETKTGYLITVSDDGAGFDPAYMPNDGRSHIGIDNVRERLFLMCAGVLTVTSKPGEGTTVTIEFSKEKGNGI